MEPRIIYIAHLVEYLATANNKQDMVNAIKWHRDNGYLTEDEAVDLAIEYSTRLEYAPRYNVSKLATLTMK